MGSEQQETKSLPRNRKCGNCRFFEPAPLWRKGWCRNPQLYPPHANHLVDSTGIDCEGGFRSRIYWEPLPVADLSDQPTPSMGTAPVIPRIYRPGTDAADSGQETASQNSIFNSTVFGKKPKPAPEPVLERDDVEFFNNGTQPLESLEDSPEAVSNPNDWRAEVRRRLPFTQTWPLERFDPVRHLPWVVAGFLAIIVLFIIVTGGKNKDNTPTDSTRAIAVATQNAQLAGSVGTGTMPAALQGSVTPNPTPTPTAPALKGKQGTITGLGGDKLRLRAEATISSEILAQLQDGDKVKILDGPVDSDKLEWYKVEFNGKIGWVVKKYVVIQQ